jgi:class 3 adenylate cyclase
MRLMSAPNVGRSRTAQRLLAGLLVCLAGSGWLLRGRAVAYLLGRLPGDLGPLLSLALWPILLGLSLGGLWLLWRDLRSALRWLSGALSAWESWLSAQLPPPLARHSTWLRALTVGSVVSTAVALIVETTPIEQSLEARAFDRWFALRHPQRSEAERLTAGGESPSLREVAVIGIDDDTVAHYGWPLPRGLYARLIDVVSRAQPASLVFDIALVEGSRENPDADRAIAEAAARAGRVYFTLLLSPESGAAPLSAAAREILAKNQLASHASAGALPDFSHISRRPMAPTVVLDVISQRAHGVAMANVVLDGDDVLRHSLTVARLGDRLLPSLSLRVAADALSVPLDQVRVYPGSHVDLGGRRRIPIDEVGRSLVRYQGRHHPEHGPVRYLSLRSLIRADAALTLRDSPMGEDQEFLFDDSTRVTLDGRPLAASAIDPQRLQPGSVVSGIARYSVDPGRVLELELSSAPSAAGPRLAAAGEGNLPPEFEPVPAFEVLDEDRLRFRTQVGKHRPLATAASLLRGRHVFVGSTALAATDVHNGPLGGFPGVEHHATMLSNILRGDFFRSASLPLRLIETGLCGLLAAIAGSVLGAGWGMFLALGVGMALLLSTFLAFLSGLYLGIVAPASALFFGYSACVVLSLRAEAKARAQAEAGREFVRRTFGRYLTDQVVEQILDSPDGLRLGGQRRFVTVLMTDLRGFTSMCGAMEPESVVALLNHYLETMTRIITRYGGTIDEFIGDAILVFFGAPLPHTDDDLRAVACAIEMLNAMAEVNDWNRQQGLPSVEMGIGIHSGELVVGNIGSEMRAKYGVVGSAINLTSRIESCTVGGQVLISETTRQRCGASLRIGQSQVITPKGVKGTLSIHEALAVAAPYHVELRRQEEQLVRPQAPLRVRYAVLVDKQVSEQSAEGEIDALSEQGLELRLAAPEAASVGVELAALANVQLRIVGPDGTPRPGELYGKVMAPRLRPGVAYLRVTSLAAELKPLWAEVLAHAAKPAPAATSLDAPLSSE